MHVDMYQDVLARVMRTHACVRACVDIRTGRVCGDVYKNVHWHVRSMVSETVHMHINADSPTHRHARHSAEACCRIPLFR